ncbi:MAG: hypothetical protein ACYDAD_04800 [Acidimicrobiales bacterium]
MELKDLQDTAGGLLSRCLADAGVSQIFGRRVPAMNSHVVRDAAVGAALADADGRLGPGAGAHLGPDGVLRLSTRPGGPAAEVVVVGEAAEIPDAVAAATGRVMGAVPATAELRLEFDLDEPAPAHARPRPRPAAVPVRADLPDHLVGPVMVLAGPGVVRLGAVEDLRRLAAAGDLAVANTWGAKGVFDWESPHHAGTVGLQARDFELGGFADAGTILATGIDPMESPPERYGLAPVIEVEPADLPRWEGTATGFTVRPELFRILAELVQPLYSATASPMNPARAVLELQGVLGAGETLVADPGPAGLWVARAFPTRQLGSVVVPATVGRGFAAAAAAAGQLRGRSLIGVTTAPLDRATEDTLEEARRLGVDLVIVVWTPDSGSAPYGDLAGAVASARAAGGVRVIPMPVDFSFTGALVAAAGEVLAWRSADS